MKRMKSISKKGLAIISLIAIIGAVVGAVSFTYFMKTTNANNVDKLYQIKDNHAGNWSAFREMGNDEIIWTPVDLAPGDSEMFSFNISLSDHANANRHIHFAVTEDTENGVDITIMQGATEVEDLDTVEWTPGETKLFTYTVSLDEYAPAGEYNCGIQLTKN